MKKVILVMLIMTSMSFAQDDTVSPWSLYGGFTSMGAGEEIFIEDVDVDLGRANGFTLGFGYALNEKVTIGAGLGQRGFSVDVPDLFGGDTGFDSNLDAKAKVKGVEFWMSYTLMDNGNFSLWAGPLYAHLYKSTGSFAGVSESESITDSDYGLMFGGSVPLRGNISMNAGYYRSLDDHEIEGMNNFFLELGYQL
ncbi:MAG: outer membrane beta-barrel protein [bacterium]